ncbi:uncharacterized protein DS421_1g17120 [Arachis hypogaea]|nr:uncharacterized protein DS421_1g17120 [Arachis hypogaea]
MLPSFNNVLELLFGAKIACVWRWQRHSQVGNANFASCLPPGPNLLVCGVGNALLELATPTLLPGLPSLLGVVVCGVGNALLKLATPTLLLPGPSLPCLCVALSIKTHHVPKLATPTPFPGVAKNNAPYPPSWQRQLLFLALPRTTPLMSKLATPTSCPACIILASMHPCFITYHQQGK